VILAPPLAITGIGMASGLGDAVSGCAAARAGMNRRVPLAFGVPDQEDEGDLVPVHGHPAGALTLGFQEVGLAVRLATLALADLFAQVALGPDDLASTAVLINLGSGFYLQEVDRLRAEADKRDGTPAADREPPLLEAFEGAKPLYTEELVEKCYRLLGHRPPSPDRRRVFFGDQAGLGQVLAAAHQLLASNTVSACLVGGVDSLVEPRWLSACEELHLLKTPMRPVGLIPGEAAAFLLVEKVRSSGARRAPLALVTACETARESHHRFSDPRPAGHALAEVVRKCLPPDGSARAATLIADLNGDAARAAEFGTALVQLQADLRPTETVVPAVSFGDTRAAAGFVGACVAVRAFARGYAGGRHCLVTCAGDDGGRAAAMVTAAS
jgi:hypothetical protein